MTAGSAPGASSGLASLAARVWNAGLDMVFPPRCVTCKSFGSYICAACRADICIAEPPRCSICWSPDDRGRCESCRYGRPAFKAVRAAFVYDGPARDAVLALKFDGLGALARLMAVPMAECLVAWDPPVSAIIPVPLSASRKRYRGYNQSELLAREVGRLAGLPVLAGVLERTRNTPPQVKQFDWQARRENVAGAFCVKGGVPGGGVLLMDDVITTGATLDACARVLCSAGGGPVFALTFARED